MSEILSLKEKTAHVEAPNEGSEHPGTAQLGESDDQSERPKSPSINAAPSISLNEEGVQPAAVPATGQQSDERIENLLSLFHDFLEAAPNKAVSGSSHIPQQDKPGRKRLFGIPKGFSQETGSNNRYDYEQKYPRDKFGEEASENARVWLTYLDEAESFDRERAEGWKETVDVLLVFAGLFSGVITTFISQASQSLQKDNTQVSASLLSEAVQLLRANFSGVPASDVPTSILTPTSPFTASTNTLLVNGLWFTSLAITLSAALFAVLAKQWLYYYLSSIPGTANEKARARQLRFNGFESWKVAAIVELLPILLHLAVGMFLTGIIILLFPLDIHIAGTIVFIAGITYTLYFISVMLPIWYPECPYTTSLTIYIWVSFFILQQVFQKITRIINKGLQALWRQIGFEAQCTVGHLVRYSQSLVGHGFMFISKLAGAVGRGFQSLRSTIFSDNLPKFTKWREDNIKKAVEHATFLDFEVVDWLRENSPNRSVHRIIARCAAVHPIIREQFDIGVRNDLYDTLEISETNAVDIRHGLCLGLPIAEYTHWRLLLSIPDVLESQLEEGEYQTYLRVADTVFHYGDRSETLLDAVNGDFTLPLSMWCYLLEETLTDATVAVHILAHGTRGLFNWKLDPTRELVRNAGLVCFDSGELGWWKFDYLCRYFELGDTDYSLEAKTDTTYHLLVTIYRNLTSDDPLITDKEKRQEALDNVLGSFWAYLPLHPFRKLDDVLRVFTEICCVDSFWCESMTDDARRYAVIALLSMSRPISHPENRLHSTNFHNLSLIYRWYSRDFGQDILYYKPPLFMLLPVLVPQNRHHLFTILLNDPDAVSHFSKLFNNLESYRNSYQDEARIYICIFPILMDLFKSVGPKKNPLFTILYNPSVLLQLWKLLVYFKWEKKWYFVLVKSKIDGEKLDELFAAMNELARSDDLKNLPYICQLSDTIRDEVRSALAASAREFGQLIGVSHTQLEATADKSAPENSASDKDHDTEERAQLSEHKNYHSVANWIKKVL